jgi:hypothetical protein
MSALGQKQTFRSAIVMSALPPKAAFGGMMRRTYIEPTLSFYPKLTD